MDIKNPIDLARALERFEELWAIRPGETAWEERAALVDAIAAYEDRHAEPPAPDPVDAILFRMEQAGLQQKDLFGTRTQRQPLHDRIEPR